MGEKNEKQSTIRKIRLCKEEGCSSQATTLGYCRLCYLKNWKQLRSERHKKAAKSLNKYIDSIVKSNPDRAISALRDNLSNAGSFEKSVDEAVYQDSFREVMADLGFREDLDGMIDNIQIDEDF